MSTKVSIRYEHDEASGKYFHLYQEVFEDDSVYLELSGFHFEASSLPGIQYEKGHPLVALRIPLEWAKKLHLVGENFEGRSGGFPFDPETPGAE